MLKLQSRATDRYDNRRFSALQRAEIAEMRRCSRRRRCAICFSALQRAEIAEMTTRTCPRPTGQVFQCSSASRKFLNSRKRPTRSSSNEVSVLFSEPKIPQFLPDKKNIVDFACFSALQRAENSSMKRVRVYRLVNVDRFSALQRAENSSMFCDLCA